MPELATELGIGHEPLELEPGHVLELELELELGHGLELGHALEPGLGRAEIVLENPPPVVLELVIVEMKGLQT